MAETTRPPVRRRDPWHPLLLAGALLVAARALALGLHFMSSDPNGNAISASPGQSLLIAVPYHGAFVLTTVWLLLAAWKLFRPLRAVITVLGIGLCLALIVVGQVDLGMQWFIGQRFSPMIFGTYVGGRVFSSDLYAPVLHHPGYFATGLVLMFGPWLALAVNFLRRRRAPAVREPSWKLLAGLAVLALLSRIPIQLAHGHQRDVARPPELLFAYHWLQPTSTPPVQDEARAVAELRQLVDPRGTSTWLDPQLPLVRAAPAAGNRYLAGPPAGAPDIFLFCVESLRGADVGFIPGNYAPGEATPTPRLDALARQGVVFARHLANGNPSPRGFFSLTGGVWDHRGSFIISGSTGTEFDALPARLHRRGYFTLGLWGADPGFDNQLFWARKWFDHIRYAEAAGKFVIMRPLGDDIIMDRLIEEVTAHDRERPGQPLYAYVASAGTHEPYTLHGDTNLPTATLAAVNAESDDRARYRLVLRELDAQIGRVLDFLATRRSTRPCLLIVTGDHSDLAGDRVPPEMRDMPHNASEWTGALVAGPSALVGPVPRVETYPTSHVDFIPTLLEFAGDREPRVFMGTNLFAAIPAQERTAVSISGRGFRLDRDGWSLFVLRDHADGVWTKPSGTPLDDLRPGTEGSPFTADDARRLREGINTWSWLIEHNRVWRGSVLTPPPAPASR